jgi:hypothetical protein
MARALGVTTAELDKLLQAGQLTAEVGLTALANQMRKDFPVAADTAIKAVNRFNNAVLDVQAKLGKSLQPAQQGLADFASQVLKTITDNDDIFSGLQSQAEEFKAVLEANPELARELGNSLGEAGQVLTTELTGAARTLTEYLKENPRAIASAVQETIAFVKALSQAVGFVAQIVKLTAQGYANLGRLGQIATTPGGSYAVNARERVERSGGDVEAFDRVLKERLKGLEGLGFGGAETKIDAIRPPA